MPDFKTVFEITWKVVLSLVIISLLSWLLYPIIEHIVHSDERNAAIRKQDAYNTARNEQEDTSAEHAKMPQSVWDKRVAWAVKHHCWFNGMNREELVLALGKPTNESAQGTYSSLSWSWQTKDCVHYSADACTEYRKEEQHIDILANGYAERRYSDNDCHTLSGEHQLLGLPVPAFHN